MRVVAPFGFYGWGNIGDECTLQGFARLVSVRCPTMRIWVASQDPSHTARVAPYFRYFEASGRGLARRWAHFSSKAYVMPGGTPIMDVLGDWPLNEVSGYVKTARKRNKPVVFIGSGTERLDRAASRTIFSRDLAPNVLHWTVRSHRDKARLIEYGVPEQRVTEAADLAWTLEPVTPDFGRNCLRELGVDFSRDIVGVNINSESHMVLKAPALFEEVAKGLDRIIEERQVNIIFLCSEVREDASFDKATSQRVMGYMKHKDRAFLVPNHYWSPQELLSLIASCSMTISTRYHFCLLSALQGIPFIALKRSDKIDDLCWDLSWPHGKNLGEATAGSLLELFQTIIGNRPALVQELKDRSERMRIRSLKNVLALDALYQ